MRQSQKIVSLILGLLAVASAAGTQSQQLQSVCNLYAGQFNRFGVQYANDISSQRCSFCQYSQDSTDGQGFARGCTVCPNYSNGQCTTCQANYVATQSNYCIPCQTGSTCCAGNNAQEDPNYTSDAQVSSTYKTQQQVTFEALVKYTGTRQVTCQTGYFAIGSVCQQLPAGCVQMKVNENYYFCTQCATGYYLDSNNVCSQECYALYNTLDPKNSKVGKCNSCISPTRCASCSLQNGYFYLEPTSASTENTAQTTVRTQDSIQVCTQCMANCIDCSNGASTCKTCATNYFYDETNKVCTLCTKQPTTFVQVNADLKITDFYTTCTNNNNEVTSYNFNTSIPQVDSLNQPAPRPIVTLSGGLKTACEIGCTACTASASNTAVCTTCMNGYYLDKSGDTPKCTACPKNSIICTWNADIKKPQVQVCQINADDQLPPYSKTYYLQLAFTAANFGDDFSGYDPENQCVLNQNNCKEMVNDVNKLGLCQSCYDQPTDFAAGISVKAQIPYTMTTGQTCRQCNQTGAAKCVTDPENPTELKIESCVDGFQPLPVNNTCMVCDKSCKTCDNNGKCLTCNTSQYFTLLDDNKAVTGCQIAYTTNPSLLEGCVSWGSGTTFPANPSCQQCTPNYSLVQNASVTDGNNKFTANLCMACPPNCIQCSNTNRSFCQTCAPGTYLQNGSCYPFPQGCATFSATGNTCKYCQSGYRLVNDSYCTLCYNPNGIASSLGQWFDCPGAQCQSGSSDDPTSSSNSPLLTIVSLSLLILSLLI